MLPLERGQSLQSLLPCVSPPGGVQQVIRSRWFRGRSALLLILTRADTLAGGDK
ncbi:hypothetical protein V5E97_33770 [Singulisphaera sp. Ch08]|uniref:Uncharacterized protein n=1 Tax=Singulisphaera sp. Ch08 TaxID=3120278 RepID=A0AAU7CDB8_9BACT